MIRVFALFTALILSWHSLAHTVDVSSIGYGETAIAAQDDALRVSLEKASGSTMFILRSSGIGSSSRSRVTSTSVTSGKVESFTIKNTQRVGGRYRVVIDAKVTTMVDPQDIKEVDIRRWEDEANSISQTRELQRKIREYKRLLIDFRGTLVDQLRAGYSVSLRSYEITNIKGDNLKGNLLIDIHVNQSYWTTYYNILKALEPVNTTDLVYEGPLDSSQRSAEGTANPIDGYLKDALVRPVPIRVGVDGVVSADVVLFKNAAYRGWGLVETIHSPNVDPDIAAYRAVGLPLGNPTADGLFDAKRSSLDCRPTYYEGSAFTCGSLITLSLPFSIKDERTLTERLLRGFFYGIMPSKTNIRTPSEYWTKKRKYDFGPMR